MSRTLDQASCKRQASPQNQLASKKLCVGPSELPKPTDKAASTRFLLDQMMEIELGGDEFREIREIHKGLLMYCSPKIQVIMDTETGKDAQISVDELFKNTSVDLFQTFRNWLYVPILRNKDGIEGVNLGRDDLVGLWLLGHELSTPSLQNIAMDYLFAKHHAEKHTEISETVLIWERAPEDSALRRAWIHLLLSNDWSRRFEMISDPYLCFWTKESLAEYMRAYMKSPPHGLPMQMASDFHVK